MAANNVTLADPEYDAGPSGSGVAGTDSGFNHGRRNIQITSEAGTVTGEVLATVRNVGWSTSVTVRCSGIVECEVSFTGEDSDWISGGFWRKASSSGYPYEGAASLDAGVYFVDGLAPKYPHYRFKEADISGSFVQIHIN